MLNWLRNLISRENSDSKALKYSYAPESVASNEERTRRELEVMCHTVREGIKDPAVMLIANKLVEDLSPKDKCSEADKLFEYIRGCIHYGEPPFDVEAIVLPRMVMETRSGDCMDICVLFAALATSLDIPARFVAIKFPGKDYYHYIYPELYIDNAWKHFEFTAPKAQSGRSYVPEGATTIIIAIGAS